MSYKLNAVRSLVAVVAGLLIVLAYVFPVLSDVSTYTLTCVFLLGGASVHGLSIFCPASGVPQ